MENVASSIGDHVDLWRTPLHQPAIMLTLPSTTTDYDIVVSSTTTTDYARMEIAVSFRRPPTTPAWRSPFHRPAIMLTLYNFGESHSLAHGGSFLKQTLLDLNLHSSVNTYSISWPLLTTFPPSKPYTFLQIQHRIGSDMPPLNSAVGPRP